MRSDGVLVEIRQVPKSLLQPKSGKIGQNVIVQKVYTNENGPLACKRALIVVLFRQSHPMPPRE